MTKFMINNRTDAWKTDGNLLNNNGARLKWRRKLNNDTIESVKTENQELQPWEAVSPWLGPRGDAPYIGLYGEVPPERGSFSRLQVYKRVGISQVEVYKRVGKSVI